MKIRLKFPKIQKSDISWFGFARLISKLSSLGVYLFLLVFISLEFITGSSTTGAILSLYYFVFTLLVFQVIRKVLLKGDYFPTISFDVESLLLVSTFAISLFISIVILQTKQSVWGGSELRSLSGLSIVAMWFMYYIIASSIISNKSFKKALTLLFIAPLVGLIIYVFNLYASFKNIADVFALMQLGFVWTIFTKGKIRWIALLNFILSCIFVFFASASAQVVSLSALLFALIFYVFRNRKNFPKYIVLLDKSTKDLKNKKVHLGHFLDVNSKMTTMVIVLLALVIGLFAVLSNPARIDILPTIVRGFNTVFQAPTWRTVLFGHGLKNIGSTAGLTVLYSFGVLPVIAFGFLSFIVIKNIIKAWKKVKNQVDEDVVRNRIIVLSSILCAVLVYLMVSKPIDEVMLIFWVALAFISALVELVNKREIKVLNELHDFKNVTDESIKEFKQFLQKLLILALAGGLVYVLMQISRLTALIS